MRAVPLNRYLVFLLIAGGGVAADLASKRFMFEWLGMPGLRQTFWICGNIFGFQTSLNEGALFGMGQGMVLLFSALSIAAAVAIAWYLFRGRRRAAMDPHDRSFRHHGRDSGQSLRPRRAAGTDLAFHE